MPDFFKIILYTLLTCNTFSIHSSPITNPCGEPGSLISIIDRPTVGDSACVVPMGNAVLEAGLQYADLRGSGQGYNLPETEIRLGLPGSNEFAVILPNFTHQSVKPHAGSSGAVIGIKHQLGYTRHWLASVESLLSLPGGSDNAGNQNLGVAFNGIVNYSFDSGLNLTFMMGATSLSQSVNLGGQRYNSVNPDLVLSYTFNHKLSVYGEVYGQTKTAAYSGSGYNSDAGFLYLLTPELCLDLEVGQRISGQLGAYNYYIGTGIGLLM